MRRILGWLENSGRFFNTKLYLQYLHQKLKKFKFKKPVLKLEISIFESYYVF